MDKIHAVTDMILEAKRVVVFTGAGVSTESGIPDFRSPGGIWDRFDPNEFTYDKFLASESHRQKFWAFYKCFWQAIDQANPNRGHCAIAELSELGKLECVITQNVDGLHQKSGIPDDKVIELHGTLKWVNCLGCGKQYPKERIEELLEQGEKVPRCSCGGIMKPTTVTFGQPLPEKEIQEARRRAASCDLFFVIGSSLVVYPAAQIPLIAKDNGARLIIINLSSTPHDHYADIVIHNRIGSTLSQIVKGLKAR